MSRALVLCMIALLALPFRVTAKEACYRDACASITLDSCADSSKPAVVTIKGWLNNAHAMSVVAWQLVGDARWELTDSHMFRRLSGSAIDGSGFTFAPSVEKQIRLQPGQAEKLTLAFGPRTGSHGYYDVVVEERLASTPQKLQLDIKPGSCPNPVNRGKKGITPVAIVGNEHFDVRTIDLRSIRLEGVQPLRFSYADEASALPESEWGSGCTIARRDGHTDLLLKFQTAELVAALEQRLGRPLFDGEIVPLRVTASLKEQDNCAAGLSGEDSIQVLVK